MSFVHIPYTVFNHVPEPLSQKTCGLQENHSNMQEDGMQASCLVCRFSCTSALESGCLPRLMIAFCLASWFQSNVLRFDVKEPFLIQCRCKITICLSVCTDLSVLSSRTALLPLCESCTISHSVEFKKGGVCSQIQYCSKILGRFEKNVAQ